MIYVIDVNNRVNLKAAFQQLLNFNYLFFVFLEAFFPFFIFFFAMLFRN